MVETRSARKAARPNGRDAEVANPPKPAAKKKAPRKASKADELPAEISPYDMTAAQLALHCYFLPMCLLLPCPVLCAVLAFATNSDAVSAPTLGGLYAFGLVFCVFLYFKGLHYPCTKDSGTSGGGFVFDYYWGMELYPRICGVDVKKFVNCRFSMTFWQLAGACYTYRSYTTHGKLDPGLFLAAVSQYVYLVKFFVWEIGYMRSIDIIVDRAGFYETWGCIVWVPTVYTLHSRICG